MSYPCQLAKEAIEAYIKEGKILAIPPKLPSALQKKAGVFVTILKKNQLRGCVGTYLPTKENLAEEIIANAIGAASQDWRFPPVKKEELANLAYEVSVLERPVLIKDVNELNPKKFGVIVKGQKSGRSALLLPNLKGLDTAQKQIAACIQKAGINPRQEKIIIYKFKTKKYR